MPDPALSTVQQERQLGRMRRLATGLLALMAVVFVAARILQPRAPWLDYVAAFAEAAMVGALADWFAVTALFRAPLGLPIPHTAIIPRNKDRIGASIASFLEHNFLTRDVIAAELAAIDFAGVAAIWLAAPVNSRAIATQAARMLPALLRAVDDEDVGRFLQGRSQALLRSLHVGPLAADLLAALIDDHHHQALFDYLLERAVEALEQHRPLIRQKIHERSPRWIPRSIDARFFNTFVEELEALLDDMRAPDSAWRDGFLQAIDALIVQLRTAPEAEAKIIAVLERTVQHPLFGSTVARLWRDLRQRLLADIGAEASATVARIDQALQAFGSALTDDAAVRMKLNAWLAAFATDVIIARRRVIADLVRRVIQSWDGETVARKFELYVGSDLQYIRINGTVVGGLVGLLLHAVSQML